ncbi:deferrochelatase/peroxidase EfeB, partial [Clavibacter lycopersici]
MTDESPAPHGDRSPDADHDGPTRRRILTRRALVAGGGLAALSAVAAVAGCTTTP